MSDTKVKIFKTTADVTRALRLIGKSVKLSAKEKLRMKRWIFIQMAKQQKPKEKKLIKTVERICKLANEGKSVYVTVWDRRSSAAWIVNWQARQLNNWVKLQRFYE